MTITENKESLIKPIGEITNAIHNTSEADLILFLVTLSKSTNQEDNSEIIIGKND